MLSGSPGHDTFERVFANLDPDAFADRFGRWMAELCESIGLAHVAIDGKSVRRSPKGTFTGCLHRVSAWVAENGLILGSRSVPTEGHEITTVPDLLTVLDLAGAVVTLDAAVCQKTTVAQTRAQCGEYAVRVKGNQKGLHDAAAGVFERGGAELVGYDMTTAVGAGHGREEVRYVTVWPSARPGGPMWACGAGVRGVAGRAHYERLTV